MTQSAVSQAVAVGGLLADMEQLHRHHAVSAMQPSLVVAAVDRVPEQPLIAGRFVEVI